MTPLHIQPEWYFLFAYAILRAIPNKLGGVIALAASVAILYFLPLIESAKFKSSSFHFFGKKILWSLLRAIVLLTWVGARPVEAPFVLVSQLLTIFYFRLFIL